MNLIGDIHGNYRTFRALLKQMPDEEPVSVGDMIDRGPRSREVLEFSRIMERPCWAIMNTCCSTTSNWEGFMNENFGS